MLVVYQKPDGFKEIKEVPTGCLQRDYHKGITIGPPDLSALGWDVTALRKLNNALVDNNIINYNDVRGHRPLVINIVRQFASSKQEERDLFKALLSIYQIHYYPENFGG